MTIRSLLVTLLILTTLLPIRLQADVERVRYPRPESDVDRRSLYPLQLLKLAFSKVDKSYQLTPTPQTMPQGRALIQLGHGIDVDVVWSMTSQERESQLQPIRIPIYKGLIGWRIFLANKRDLDRFSEALPLTELRKFNLIQGHDWPDTTILRANGFTVFGTSNYEAIFDMLSHSRADLFPRSIVEIWDEAKNHQDDNIVVEPTKILIYPTAMYFFVSPKNKKLALDIENGLRAALKDGSFDLLFNEYHAKLIKQANLNQRHKYYLNNPTLPLATPVTDEKLWFAD